MTRTRETAGIAIDGVGCDADLDEKGFTADLQGYRASFETRPSGAPQDEADFFGGIKRVPHPEEAAQRPSRRTHVIDPEAFLTGAEFLTLCSESEGGFQVDNQHTC